MKDAKEEHPGAGKELREQKRLLKLIGEWVGKNKKVFWKYEVSCFYKTYTMRLTNLPKPSPEDITVTTINRLITGQQKKQLADAIAKASIKTDILSDTFIDVQIDFADGYVVTEIV